jgi:2-polyprenyl-6-methoxyphenol hydroxylase-like FAD-dependent oxidoreductase
MSARAPSAEIAGAGLAGLAVAAALAQRGWHVRVHEKGHELREIGAGIYLFQNALDGLRELGVYDQVAACGVRSEQPRLLLDHAHREVNVRRAGDPLPELIVILRTELHRILSRKAVEHGVEIITDSQVIGASPAGRLELSGGTSVPADLVVGADGVFSRVRDSLGLATRVVEVQDGCGRHLIQRNPTDSVNTRRVEMWNAGRRIGIAPASRDQHYLFLCCPASDLAGRMQQPFNLQTWAESHGPYRDYLERLPSDPPENWRPFFNVTCSSWFKGRVCLVGDAAHGMTPNLGQGAGVSIVSAVVLSRALATKGDVPDALQLWEQSEKPYVTRTQRVSYLYGMVGTRWPRGLLGLRSKLLPLLSRSDVFQRNLRCAIEHQPTI